MTCVRRLRIFGRFRQNSNGSTAVEFGIIALPFLAIIAAIFELGMIVFDSEVLSAAVTKAARAMLTGQMQQAGNVTTAAQFVNTYLCPATGRILPGSFDCSKLIVDVRTATSFTAADMSNAFYKGPTMFCPGAPQQIVVMRVIYPLGTIFPLNIFNPTAGTVNDVPGLSGSYHLLMGTAVFLEENYAGTYTAPAGC